MDKKQVIKKMLEDKKEELEDVKQQPVRLEIIKEFNQEMDDNGEERKQVLQKIEQQEQMLEEKHEANIEEIKKVISFLENKLDGNSK